MAFKLASAFVLTVLIASCVSPIAGWRTEPNSSLLVYEPLKLHFAPVFEDLVRLEPRTYDKRGENVSIGYNSTTRRLALTLYVYPRTFGGQPDPEQHFRAAIAAAIHLKPQAKVERAASMPIPIGVLSVPGYNAFLHWPEPDHEAGSFLLLIPQADRFLKLRVTFLWDGSGEPITYAWGLTQRFLRSLNVTASTPAA